MPFLLGSCWDEVRSAVNGSVPVRSEERAIYTLSRNLTVQIYIGSSNTDLGTSDVNRKHCSRRVGSPHEEVNVGTPDVRRDFRRAQSVNQQSPRCRDSRQGLGLSTVGSSDVRRDF